jgi:hypothetical protein
MAFSDLLSIEAPFLPSFRPFQVSSFDLSPLCGIARSFPLFTRSVAHQNFPHSLTNLCSSAVFYISPSHLNSLIFLNSVLAPFLCSSCLPQQRLFPHLHLDFSNLRFSKPAITLTLTLTFLSSVLAPFLCSSCLPQRRLFPHLH